MLLQRTQLILSRKLRCNITNRKNSPALVPKKKYIIRLSNVMCWFVNLKSFFLRHRLLLNCKYRQLSRKSYCRRKQMAINKIWSFEILYLYSIVMSKSCSFMFLVSIANISKNCQRQNVRLIQKIKDRPYFSHLYRVSKLFSSQRRYCEWVGRMNKTIGWIIGFLLINGMFHRIFYT